MGYAIRITARAVEDQTPGIVAAEASGDSHRNGAGARPKSGRMLPQGSGWALEGSSISPYASYANTPLTGGSLLPLPLRACSPLLGARLRTSFLRVLILFRPTHQWRLVMEQGLALGSLRHRVVYGLLIVWGRCLGQRTGEYEGLTPSYSHFPPSPNLAISTNGNGTGSADVI